MPIYNEDQHSVILRIQTPIILAWFTVLLIGCAPKDKYLNEATGKATQEEIMQKWGTPRDQRTLSTGESVWVYRELWNLGHGAGDECHEYEVTFDMQKVLKRWRSISC